MGDSPTDAGPVTAARAGFLVPVGYLYGWRPALVVALPGLVVAALVLRLREPRRGTADMMAALGATSTTT